MRHSWKPTKDLPLVKDKEDSHVLTTSNSLRVFCHNPVLFRLPLSSLYEKLQQFLISLLQETHILHLRDLHYIRSKSCCSPPQDTEPAMPPKREGSPLSQEREPDPPFSHWWNPSHIPPPSQAHPPILPQAPAPPQDYAAPIYPATTYQTPDYIDPRSLDLGNPAAINQLKDTRLQDTHHSNRIITRPKATHRRLAGRNIALRMLLHLNRSSNIPPLLPSSTAPPLSSLHLKHNWGSPKLCPLRNSTSLLPQVLLPQVPLSASQFVTADPSRIPTVLQAGTTKPATPPPAPTAATGPA